MPSVKQAKIDLLRNRRKEAGQSALNFIPTNRLRNKGLFIGTSFISLSLLACLYAFIINQGLDREIKNLNLQVESYNQLKNDFSKTINEIRQTIQTNKQIAKGIKGIRSGSALLSEIKEISPNTIQIKNLSVKKNKLTIKGQSFQPDALESINAFKLQLENSLIIDHKNIFLVNAKEGSSSDIKAINSLPKKILKFNIIANFSNLDSDKLKAHLERLGSFGLAKRIDRLKMEGF